MRARSASQRRAKRLASSAVRCARAHCLRATLAKGRMAAEIARAGFTKLMENDDKSEKMGREEERGIR